MLLRFDIIEDKESDMNSLYQMKSESNDIYWSGYTKAPDLKKFSVWYKEQLQRTDRKIWLVRQIQKPEEMVGYLYLTFENDVVNISHGVKQNFGGQGIGSQIINFATNICLTFYPAFKIESWIAETNIISVKTFLKNNFQKTVKMKKCYYESFQKEITMFNYSFLKG
jgi:RimJ/RimL family protein N-acetyltransferase